jgi:methionyl aminopeptidase
MIKIHTKENFEHMRKSGKLAAQVLDNIISYVKPGVTTDYLNDICHEFIVSHGAIPAPLGYRGSGKTPFPKSICTSVNHVICHGIPGDKKLKDGDIMNIDVTVILDGWFGDTSRMYFVGDAGIKAQRLTQVTHDAMMLGIAQVKPGAHFGDIGYAIQQYAEKHGYSTVEDYTGHGIGQVFHDEPAVLHYGKAGSGPMIQAGMFFTVEPMLNAGKKDTILSSIDHWTVTTRDKSLSAQFEHTIGVTEDGYEIFTLSEIGFNNPPYGNK